MTPKRRYGAKYSTTYSNITQAYGSRSEAAFRWSDAELDAWRTEFLKQPETRLIHPPLRERPPQRKADNLDAPTSLSEIEQQNRDRERRGPIEQWQVEEYKEESDRQRVATQQAQAQLVAQQEQTHRRVHEGPQHSQQSYEAQVMRAHDAQLKIVKQQQQIQDTQNQPQGNGQLTPQERVHQPAIAATQTNDTPMDHNGQSIRNPQRYTQLYQQRLLRMRHDMSQRYITQYGPPKQYPYDIALEYGPGLERTAKAWINEVIQRERETGRPALDFTTTDQTYDDDDLIYPL